MMSCQCQCGSTTVYDYIDRIVERYQGEEGALIPVLHQVQEAHGYLPEEIQAYIAEKLNVTLSEVYGVVSF